MVKFYKRLLLVLSLTGLISGTVIYYTVDIHTFYHLNAFKSWSLLAVLIFLGLGLYFDGTRLVHLVRISGEDISLMGAVQVVFSNYFLAALTPGAAGGAVAQVLFLRRAGVPTGKATVIVVVRTILSVLFLLLCLPMVLYFDPGLMPWLSENLLRAISATIILGIFSIIWLLRKNTLAYFLVLFTKRLHYTRRRRIFSVYRDVRGAILMLSSAPVSMVRVFLESAASLLSLYSVVPVLFMGMGVDPDLVRVMGRMVLLNLLLYFAPTPGGSGIAEGGFIVLFSEFLPSGTVGITAVVWRMIVEYIPFVIGLYFTVKVFGRNFLASQIK